MKPISHYAAIIALGCSLGVAQAQGVSPQPEPGLWRSEATTLINGQNMQDAMGAARDEALANIPPEHRAMAEQMMPDPGDQNVQRECFTPEQAAELTDPEALIARAREDMPECTLNAEQTGPSTLKLNGSCAGSEGFNGDISGELTMVNAREMRSQFSGRGHMAMDAESVPPSMQDMFGDGEVNFEHRETSKWVSADCGNVEPW